MKILIDSREPKKIKNFFNKLDDTEICELPVGDFICEEKGIVIERKDIFDYIGSIKSKHIHKQLMQMEQFPHKYLLISGKLSSVAFAKHVHWTVEQHLGSLASIAVRFNVKILMIDNDTQLCKLVMKIIKKTDDGKTFSLKDTELLKNTITTDDMKLKILTCFNGVGLKKAEKLVNNTDINQLLESLINKF